MTTLNLDNLAVYMDRVEEEYGRFLEWQEKYYINKLHRGTDKLTSPNIEETDDHT